MLMNLRDMYAQGSGVLAGGMQRVREMAEEEGLNRQDMVEGLKYISKLLVFCSPFFIAAGVGQYVGRGPDRTAEINQLKEEIARERRARLVEYVESQPITSPQGMKIYRGILQQDCSGIAEENVRKICTDGLALVK
jgi:hypothetical protein